MKSEDLLRNIGSVDNKYVDELYEEMYAPAKKKKKGINWGALAASVALIAFGTAAMFGGAGDVKESKLTLSSNRCELAMAQNTVVMLDVNPSVSLMVNDRGIVVEVRAENEDAEALEPELNVCGEDYDTAVKDTVAVLQNHGYITELKNSMLITVLDADPEKAETMRQSLVDTVCAYNESMDYGFSILSQVMQYDGEISKLASEYSMSAGRALLLEKICGKYEDFDFSELAANNIQTINQMFEYTELPELIFRVGSAAGVVPQEYIAELGLGNLSSDDLLSFTSAVSDFYDKLCEYYDMPDVAQHIGYVFDIIEGNTTDGDTLWAVLAESLEGSHGAIINIGESSISDWFTPDRLGELSDYLKNLIDAA